MRIVKLICLIVLELVLVLLFCAPSMGPHPQSHLRAFTEWQKNPTAETTARWEEENEKLQRNKIIVDIVLLTALGLTTFGMAISFRNPHKGRR